MREKFVPDPQQIIVALPGERRPRPDAGMNKKEVATCVGQRKGAEKLMVAFRQSALQACGELALFLLVRIEARPQAIR
ncbi:protein of unknown function [Methylocella tundrae]|uniref:Uncharacterized protein n=1 Tax=Methylocella tundrae TaxID=227605 RepID=A0A4U8Z0D8_METTU|nr:protein of unknown function [Methylocella tundrae]